MTDQPYHFYNRQQIADYFRVTRMTLYRWEKIIPLDDRPGGHLRHFLRSEVDKWFIKVHRSPQYTRPHARRHIGVTSRRRGVTCSRDARYRRAW